MSALVRTIRTLFGTARTHPVQRAALRYRRLFIESLKKKHRLSKKDSNSKFSRTRIYHIAFVEFSRDLLLADFLFRACRFVRSRLVGNQTIIRVERIRKKNIFVHARSFSHRPSSRVSFSLFLVRELNERIVETVPNARLTGSKERDRRGEDIARQRESTLFKVALSELILDSCSRTKIG